MRKIFTTHTLIIIVAYTIFVMERIYFCALDIWARYARLGQPGIYRFDGPHGLTEGNVCIK